MKNSPRTNPEKIFQVLKKKIIWLELKPESTLNLSDLAKSFGVSRYPVTLALYRLEAEGWVSRHGTQLIVTPLRLKRIKEITEIRSELEVKATVLAAKRITPAEINELLIIGEEFSKLDDTSSFRQMVELDVKFHKKIFEITKNSELSRLLEELLSHYHRFMLSLPNRIEPRSFFSNALEMIRAFKTKDEKAIQTYITKHIKTSANLIFGMF